MRKGLSASPWLAGLISAGSIGCGDVANNDDLELTSKAIARATAPEITGEFPVVRPHTDEAAPVDAQLDGPPPREWIDPKGNVWKRVSDSPARIATEEEESASIAAARKAPPGDEGELNLERMEVEELAQLLRMTTLRYGYEYVSEPNLEHAAKLKAGLKDAISEPGFGLAGRPPTDMPEDATLRGQDVIGGDTRSIIRNNTTYPYSTTIALRRHFSSGPSVQCTATMIGPSTALTAAHCLKTSSNVWQGWKAWAPATDLQDAREIRYPYDPLSADFPYYDEAPYVTGFVQGCYAGFVPLVYNGDVGRDYAILEFDRDWWDPSVCELEHFSAFRDHPGDQTGWLGFAVSSDATILTSVMTGSGYPAEDLPGDDCPGGSCFWPTIWSAASTATAVTTNTVRNRIDNTNGQSGMGMYLHLTNGKFVVSINKGEWTTCSISGTCETYNYGRRITGDVWVDIVEFSEL